MNKSSPLLDGERRPRRTRALCLLLIAAALCYNLLPFLSSDSVELSESPPLHASAIQERCRRLNLKPGPPSDFYSRTKSDRFVPGTRPYLLRNASIWTGERNGTDVARGNILISRGIIKALTRVRTRASGHEDIDGEDQVAIALAQDKDGEYEHLEVINLHGAWLTPGIVDLHSHIGDGPSPALSGSQDYYSPHGPITPWMRALDGLNTHDVYALSVAGGVTTALVLPGSDNAIGGEGFTIKLRKTAERSPTSMLLEPPYTINGTEYASEVDGPPRWRHMKHACGENPRWYRMTRMDIAWSFRSSYETARQIKEAQDDFCSHALSNHWSAIRNQAFPEDLQWEAMVDILRGKVKVQAHCYEPVDLDQLIRIAREFSFPIAAVHHASSAYLVPGLLHSAPFHPPAVALFATNGRYKREAYRASEFAPAILASHGLDVVMKSDHSVLNERYLLYEAQQAFFYGLPENLALASVTSTPARVAGLDHRVGLVKRGWDADLVVWDAHPLALGATPKQVYIDGVPQLAGSVVNEKPVAFQRTPEVPDFGDEAQRAVEYDGLPPLEPAKRESGTVLFANVSSVFVRTANGEGVEEQFNAASAGPGVVLVRGGRVLCSGLMYTCSEAYAEFVNSGEEVRVLDIKGGAVQPGLATFGSPLGLVEMEAEASTQDGVVLDPLVDDVPEILGGNGALIRAADGLAFGTRDQWHAYRAGVTVGIAAPLHAHFLAGLGTAFHLGARHRLERGALVQDVTALHVAVGYYAERGAPSVSTQVAALRNLLLGHGEGELGARARNVAEGKLTLVVRVQSADVIATLLLLKQETEAHTGKRIKMTLAGATEAHLLAKEIGEAGVGVILVPVRPFPFAWESRRILSGPPLTNETSVSKLLAHKVTVGLGVIEKWDARNVRFDLAWVALEAGRRISRAQAYALASTNLEKLVGGDVEATAAVADLVVTEGGDLLSMESRVVAVIAGRRGDVDLF